MQKSDFIRDGCRIESAMDSHPMQLPKKEVANIAIAYSYVGIWQCIAYGNSGAG